MKKAKMLHSPLSQKSLIYGLFAVICNLVAILFLTRSTDSPAYILSHKFAPFLEYPIMTVVILVAGAMLFDITAAEQENKK